MVEMTLIAAKDIGRKARPEAGGYCLECRKERGEE